MTVFEFIGWWMLAGAAIFAIAVANVMIRYGERFEDVSWWQLATGMTVMATIWPLCLFVVIWKTVDDFRYRERK